MARQSLGELFFKLLADTSDLASAKKEVNAFSDTTKKSADEINKAAANVDKLAEAEKEATDEAKQLHKNAEKVVAAHKQAAKEAATLAEAEKIAADEANNIKKNFEGLGPLIAGAVAGLSVAGILGGVKQLSAVARTLENASKSLGIGVNTLSQYQYAFKQLNLDGDKVVDMFKDINERVSEFANTGGGELADILKRTNLNINELINLSPDQQLLKIYDALEDIEGITQAEITAYLEQLVSDAAILQPLLADGATELKRFREEGEALGVTLDQLEVDRLIQVDEEIRQLTAAFDGLTNDLVIAFAPAVADVAGGLSIFLEAATGSREEAAKLKKITDVSKESFIDVGFALTDADNAMRLYASQSAAERAEAKKSIESTILKTEGLIKQRKARIAATYADAQSIRANKGLDFFGSDERAAARIEAEARKLSSIIVKESVGLSQLRKKLNNLGDPSKVPAPLPRTFAQTSAAAEAEKKAVKEQAQQEKRDKAKADRDAKSAARTKAAEERKAANEAKRTTREAQRATAKKVAEDKKIANEATRADEKTKREQERAAKELTREQEKLQKIAEAETQAATSALERVQTDLLTRQEKENQAYAQSLADLKAAEDAKIATLLPYNELRQRLEKEHQEALATIKADVENRDQAQNDIDNVVGGLTGFELEEENTQYAADLEALAVARELKLETIASYDEIERAIEQAHQEELLKIKANGEKAALDNQLKAYRMQTKGQQAALGGMLELLKASGAEQSGIYKAMFAASKAFAIAESVIKIQQGIANASALPFPANLAAIGTVLSATASIVSTIRGAQFEGRQYGGPTAANTGYQVNETGVPEIYSQGGRDYLLTGSQRGKVTPLKDSKASSGNSSASGTMRITVNVDGIQQESTMTSKEVEEIALDVVTRKAGEVVAQDFANPNSSVSSGLKENYKVSQNL